MIDKVCMHVPVTIETNLAECDLDKHAEMSLIDV